MRLHVCGSRGSTPAPGAEHSRYGGHTSSIAIGPEAGPPDLLLDAGTGIRRVSELLGDAPFQGSVLLGHLHWDHTHGLPFFRAGDHPDSRVDVYLPEQEGDARATVESVMGPPHFPITPTDLDGHWQFLHLAAGIHKIEGYEVTALPIPHKGGQTFGFRVDDGSATVAYLSDHHPASLGPGPDGYGPYHETAVALASGVDLLIHDAQYLEEEWEHRSHFGHSTPTYALGLAAEAGAHRLLMFHHDPNRTDDELDRLGAQWAAIAPFEVLTAREGQAIDVVHR